MIVFAADLHLTPLVWLDQLDMRGDAYASFVQIVSHCLEHKASALVLGGDVFNKTRPDSASVKLFEEGVTMLSQVGVLIYFIQGQHDRADPPWASSLTLLAQYIGDGKAAAIDIDGVPAVVRGYDCMPGNQLRETLEAGKAEPYDILLIHQLAKSFIPFEGAWDFDMEWVPDGVELVLGGDYHEPVNEGKLWYSGSTHSRNITEFGPRSFITVGRHEDGTLDVQRVPLQTRDVIEVTIIVEDQLATVVETLAEYETPDHDALPGLISKPLVFARYNADIPMALPQLETVCRERGFILRTKAVVGGVEVVAQVTPPQGAVTLEACLAQAVDRKADESFYSFVLALLKAEDPRDVLVATKAQLGIT